MKKSINSSIFAFAGILVVGSSQAAVIDNTVITDSLNRSGFFTTSRLLGVTITGDEAVYMVGTLNLDPLAPASAFTEAALATAAGRPTAFGHNFGGTNISIVRNGGGTVDSGLDFSQGIPTTFALKVNQLTGDQWLWVNPNFGAIEDLGSADATANAAFSAAGGQPVVGSALDRVVFRGGAFSGAPGNVTDFTDFSVYYDGDTPFATAIIPEPSSLSLLAVAGLLAARRRR